MSFLRPLCMLALLLITRSAQANFLSRLVNLRKEDIQESRDYLASYDEWIVVENGIPYAQLLNHSKLPLVGLGVGNLQNDLIPSMVSEAMQQPKWTNLIETAHV